MITFFRKIRYDLIGKNKTGQYLKYAIGEILLVVIGILIALNVSNLNEIRKNTSAFETHMDNLEEEYYPKSYNEVGVIDMPYTILEAFACQLPVLSTKIDAILKKKDVKK